MTAERLDGKRIAQEIREEIAAEVIYYEKNNGGITIQYDS